MKHDRTLRKRAIRVAVVDDDTGLMESISDLLASAGYDALGFASARAMLDHGQFEHIDCLISDIRMPEVTGPQLVMMLRERQVSVPVIFMTAHDPGMCDAQAHSQLTELVKILRKPFDAQSLLNAVQQAVQPGA